MKRKRKLLCKFKNSVITGITVAAFAIIFICGAGLDFPSEQNYILCIIGMAVSMAWISLFELANNGFI